MDKHIVLGVHITDRVKHVPAIQLALTEYGCYIKTRLGLHEADKAKCSPNGLLLLEMVDDDAKVGELEKKLKAVEGVEVQKMIFKH